MTHKTTLHNFPSQNVSCVDLDLHTHDSELEPYIYLLVINLPSIIKYITDLNCLIFASFLLHPTTEKITYHFSPVCKRPVTEYGFVGLLAYRFRGLQNLGTNTAL